MTTALSRRAALTGAVASVAMAGAAVVVATPVLAKLSGVSPNLAALLTAYDRAYAAWQEHCTTISEPAEAAWEASKVQAEADNPHVAMTIDMSWYDQKNPTRTLTTANRIDVNGAVHTAGYRYEPAELWSTDQHRHFAEVRRFNAARIERDGKIAAAAKASRLACGIDAAQAAEDQLWDLVAAARNAAVAARPHSIADITAKLAFYAESHAIDGEEELLAQISTDVASITAGGASSMVVAA